MPDLIVWGRRELSKMERDLDRLIHEMCFDFGLTGSGVCQVAGVAFHDQGDNLVLRMEVGEFEARDIDLTIEDGHVVIQAVKRRESARGAHSETLRREFSLPLLVDSEKAEASLEDGVLTVTAPKRTGARGAKVRVHGK